MRTAEDMLDFIRGKAARRFAASPLFTSVYTQALHKQDWLGASNDPQTIEDIITVGQDCGFVPFFEVLWFETGVMDYSNVRDNVSGDTCERIKTFRTPHGEYTLIDRFKRCGSRSVAKYAFSPQDLDAYEYVIERSIDNVEQCHTALREVMERAGTRAVPYFNVSNSHKCFSLIESTNRIFLLMDHPERMLKICELNEKLAVAATRIASDCGVQVFFGATEGSLYSPGILETFAIPFLLKRRTLIRELGGLFYLHECSRMQDFLDAGMYARLCPDVLEGFQPPPSGDIVDMPATARKLPQSVITKGNLDLNFLLNADSSAVKDACLEIMGGMNGRRHIMGGSCSALPGTPFKNFRAIVEAVETANKSAEPDTNKEN